ncbi:eeig1/ehbp1 protein amino-terminal domain protein [Anaeramoeba ignava]|uniref:Eeig1/ehbp1 protein amino-terminal domain protein n=1 Tax=Anaeramoeba ignava TaxID=1746090 RepID=A0A9Q0R6M9_ANAIG|nr:eeig1/ehbp1 protein amino-terminal domain protein [Anaeramoeba ignava]
MNKSVASTPSTCRKVCPSLNFLQIHRILSNFLPDKFDTEIIKRKQLDNFLSIAKLKYPNQNQNLIQQKIEHKKIQIDFVKISLFGWDKIPFPLRSYDSESFYYLNFSFEELFDKKKKL